MFEIVKAGGVIMIPLIICSIIAFAIILERFWYLRKKKIVPRRLIKQMYDAIENNQIDEQMLQNMRNSSPLGEVLAAGLSRRNATREQVKEALQETGSHVMHNLERFLNALGTIAAISPLIGLLGTVLGMITVFTAITISGVGNPSDLSGGISKALITTAAGLTIAIPSLIFYRHFKAKVESFVVLMEQEALKLVEATHGEENFEKKS